MLQHAGFGPTQLLARLNVESRGKQLARAFQHRIARGLGLVRRRGRRPHRPVDGHLLARLAQPRGCQKSVITERRAVHAFAQGALGFFGLPGLGGKACPPVAHAHARVVVVVGQALVVLERAQGFGRLAQQMVRQREIPGSVVGKRTARIARQGGL